MAQYRQDLHANARECRMLAATSLTDDARAIFEEMAASYEELADSNERRPNRTTASACAGVRT